jgi:hypothetical protein
MKSEKTSGKNFMSRKDDDVVFIDVVLCFDLDAFEGGQFFTFKLFFGHGRSCHRIRIFVQAHVITAWVVVVIIDVFCVDRDALVWCPWSQKIV